ncbi:MAG TPA: hypothetical protein VN520_05560, partial [Streptomyces sp.]|uniref:hypothetical protein n=1 Tax=Streptomyces sp. TaxID=1931 RepID=UPI002CCB989C
MERQRIAMNSIMTAWQCGSRGFDNVPGDAVFDTRARPAATGVDVSGGDQRPSLELCAAGPSRARRAAATKPMPTTAVTDGLGDHRSAAMAMPGGVLR